MLFFSVLRLGVVVSVLNIFFFPKISPHPPSMLLTPPRAKEGFLFVFFCLFFYFLQFGSWGV